MLHLLSLMLLLAQPPLAQEPPPSEDPVPPAEQEPEREDQTQDPPERLNRQQAMAEIAAAIEDVRLGFTDVDRVLTEARDQAESAAEEAGAPVHEGLLAAAQHAEDLIADMELLLSLLPEDDSQESQSQANSSSQSASEGHQQRDPRDRPEPRQEPDLAQDRNQGRNHDANDVPPDQLALPVFILPGASGSWGHLPPRLQETLENAHAEDLPLRYRKLLQQFHGRQQRVDG